MSAAVKLLLILLGSAVTKRKSVTTKTDTGFSSYYYMVKTPKGEIRRMETIASSIQQAQELASREVEAYRGKMLCKVKLARKYEWQKSI